MSPIERIIANGVERASTNVGSLAALSQRVADLETQNVALQKIARAAIEYRNAHTEYNEEEIWGPMEAPIPDSVVERMANADCELENLLEEYAGLY